MRLASSPELLVPRVVAPRLGLDETAARAPFGLRGPVLTSLILVYLIWGSTYLALRYVVEVLPPLLASGARFLLAGGVLFAVLRVRGVPAPTSRQWLVAVPVGVLMLVVGNGLVAVAQREVPSGAAAASVASIPLFVALMNRVLGVRPSRRQWAGLVVGFAGVLVMSVSDARTSAGNATLLVLAPCGWAMGTVLAARVALPGGLMSAAVQMITGGSGALLLGLVTGESATPLFAQPPPLRAALAFAYLVVFGSLVAFSAYNYLLQHAPGPVATSYGYVNPVIAVILGTTLGGERLRATTLLAGALVVIGVVTIMRGARRAAAQ
ncbi:MAG TPA: drug/metabolite exporter YedA [Polyangia bacterium]